jgi:tRNA dimethylallyltransferase
MFSGNSMNKKINIIVICGPTASGKTALAVNIARKINGEIISADSRQVYRSMDIGTGKDLLEYSSKESSIPYHLIDITDPSNVYTVYDYKRDFTKAYNDIRSRKRMPILAGGTGLYIEAVLRNYDFPGVPEDPQLRSELMQKDKIWLQNELETNAPDIYKKTDLSSKKRIVRALEVAGYQNKEKKEDNALFPVLEPLILCTRWQREELHRRIDERLRLRLNLGLIDEVKQLLDSGISRSRFSLFGMEYKHVARYIDGEVSYTEMTEQLQTSIHQLAKRQNTWFRGMERRGNVLHWIDGADFQTAMSIVVQYVNFEY